MIHQAVRDRVRAVPLGFDSMAEVGRLKSSSQDADPAVPLRGELCRQPAICVLPDRKTPRFLQIPLPVCPPATRTSPRKRDIRPGCETSFIYGVALRIAADHTRRSALVVVELEDASSVPAEGPSPADRLDQRRARELLDTVLDRMSLDLRTVLVLVELGEMEVR
jgi:hypothetical protein